MSGPTEIPGPMERFEQLIDRLVGDPEVSTGTGFGSAPGLRVSGRIFAMLVRDELVVKLPRSRVDELVSSGMGERFDPGHGRTMKEWLSVAARSAADWVALAEEAFRYVGRRS